MTAPALVRLYHDVKQAHRATFQHGQPEADGFTLFMQGREGAWQRDGAHHGTVQFILQGRHAIGRSDAFQPGRRRRA